MTIELTWHLILVIIITFILLIKAFQDQESGLDLSAFFYGIILVIIWITYGGIYIW